MAKKKTEQSEFTKVLLYDSGENEKFDKLLEIYKQDRTKARIIFQEESSKLYNPYGGRKIYAFEYANGDFRLVTFDRKISFSKNNVIYDRDGARTNLTIVYKKLSNSFYAVRNGVFKPLTFNVLMTNTSHVIIDYLIKKFGWLRNVSETEIAHHLTLTNIATKKLFSREKLIKHVWGVNHHLAKKLTTLQSELKDNFNFYFFWKENKHLMINLDKLNIQFFKNHLIHDLFRFAKMFNVKVNCGWGENRVRAMHDELYKKYIDIILEFKPLQELNIRQVYKDFAGFTNFEMLLTNHDLINEGKKQNHCVGTYVGKVNNGDCAIYVIGDYTLEIRFDRDYNHKTNKYSDYYLKYGQCRGYKNADAPQELKDVINGALFKFNNTMVKEKQELYVKEKTTLNVTKNTYFIDIDDALPF